MGQLWENYVVLERLKRQEYLREHTNFYFWRTYDRKEIELVEDREGRLFGYEIKWQRGRQKIPKPWLEGYPGAHFEVIHRDNYLKFIT